MILPGHDRSGIWESVFCGEPIPEEARQPASVDLRLGNRFIIFDPATGEGRERYLTAGEELTVAPGAFFLASTAERVHIPAGWQGQVDGKSTHARRGLTVHVTAGFIDPGFDGVITLEIVALSPYHRPMLLPGEYIAQLSLRQMLYPVEEANLYRGHYQGAAGPQLGWR